jgi:predicted transcriptional regulator
MEKKPKEEQQIRLLVELSDENGYSQTELTKILNIKKSNMSTMCDDLKKQGLIYGKYEPEKKRERGERGQGNYFYIGAPNSASHQEKLNIFKLILKLSLVEFKPDLEKSLLASKYVNSLIKTCGLMPFYEILEEHMGREEFRRIASETLLGQSALIEEYVKLPPTILRGCIESEKEMVIDPVAYLNNSLYENYLKKLFKFNIVESIRFYRKYLAKPFGKLYRDLADMDDGRRTNPNISEGIKRFLDLDIFLSPVTSFPENSPISLLFARPFERLYADIYILDDSEYDIMVQRA